MKKVLKVIGWILLILLLALAVAWFGFLKPKPPPISDGDRAEITLMPLPAQLKLGNGVWVLDEDLSHKFTSLATPRMDRALTRFYHKLSGRTGLNLGGGGAGRLILECTGSAMDYPSLEDDESYSMQITGGKITVRAPSETGIIYALESLLQLVREEDGHWVFPQLKLEDSPRYPWRGLMIDVCRHWIPKEVLLRNLDAMAAVKLNVLHLHLTEHQGFRVESKLFPKLHEMGSNGDYYSQEDIREVVEYAADRGIRVVPEFDVPGHTQAWFVGHPELASAPGPYSIGSKMTGLAAVMDPSRDEVYEFLDLFFGEMSDLFPDRYFHIGGDEVAPRHWNENKEIQSYMKEKGLEDSHALQAHFNVRLEKMVAGHGKIMAGWDEILHPDLPGKGLAMQTWRNHASLWESARQGYKAILSAGYYLDHKQPASYHYKVDPTVIPGAVDIEVDSTNWKSWDCLIHVADMEMDGALYLFGEGAHMRGIMDFMGTPAGISTVELAGNSLRFVVETDMANLEFETEIKGDSLSGGANVSIISLDLTAWRSGGSDRIHGTPLPEFKKIAPLTPEEEALLIGGEACMWTEMVDQVTIDSRIWPRAASIGEKLWSPKILNDNEADMYRRLLILDERLEESGLHHHSYRQVLIEQMVEPPLQEALFSLASVLQEEKYFNRLAIYEPEYALTMPLDRMVDAAPPESYVAYSFGLDVEQWNRSQDEGARERLWVRLESWSSVHGKLASEMDRNWKLKEVESHSKHLSKLADIGLQALSDPATLKGKKEEVEELLAAASNPQGGCTLAVVEAVQKLVESAMKN